jgi:hypothetical protein
MSAVLLMKAATPAQVHRNLDPALHPHEKAVEYTRALNAAKLQRVFAKPFLGSLPHTDGVTCLARSPAHLNSLVGAGFCWKSVAITIGCNGR